MHAHHEELQHKIAAYGDELEAFFKKRLDDPEEAKDMRATVQQRALANLANYRGDGSPRAWLYAIARNLLCNYYRETSRRPGQVVLNDDHHPRTRDPQDLLELKQDADLALQALEQLPERRRQCLYLHALEQYSNEEIATILKLKPNTVRSTLHQARHMLKKLLRLKN